MNWIAPLFLSLLGAAADAPQATDSRLVVERFVAEPDLVTPTGIAVDHRGRVLVIESHTHFRPDDYPGPPADRIRMLEDTDGDGRADRISTFFEGTRLTMNLAVYADGSVYVATRNELFRLRDSDGDGRADQRTPIARLDTPGNYPHNGLSGFAFDASGDVYFGLGENLGAEYRLIGSDGTTLHGGGEGGNIYRCRPDGSGLRRLATGFWNPFHLAFDAFGHLFAVDNDPDSRPPCRLLHVVPGGDYGYRFRNGRKGLHPFTAWNGELPGTLPMVAGTGEAPSGIVAYESDGLPSDYRGQLLVTSWGDHRLDRFQLERRGASFTSRAVPFVTGGENFRPVGIAVAPDGSLYISDWVDKSYTLHGKGRIWRVRAKQPPAQTRPAERPEVESPDEGGLPMARAAALRQADHAAGEEALLRALHDVDPFIRQAAREGLRRVSDTPKLRALAASDDAAVRLAGLLILRESTDAQAARALPKLLADADPDIRFAAVQWVAEAALAEHRPRIEALLAESGTRALFEGCLAALERLDRAANPAAPLDPNKEMAGEEYVARLLMAEATPPIIRTRALRMLRPTHPALSLDRLKQWLSASDEALRMEAIRTLRESSAPDAQQLVAELAGNAALPGRLRAEAVMGLSGQHPADIELLLALAGGKDRTLRDEALRSLRNTELSDEQRAELLRLANRDPAAAALVERVLQGAPPKSSPPPEDLSAWLRLLAESGDAEAGERVFFHPKAAGCYRCHQVDGRGGRIGPDLTTTARVLDRRRLVESILQPSQEIAPQFVAYTLATTDGRTLTGLLLGENAGGDQTYADAEGRLFTLGPGEIDQRQPHSKSIMPDNLSGALTLEEFRDLLTFLQAQASDRGRGAETATR